MEEITIYKFQLEEIINALRLTININGCNSNETAYDRTVMRARQMAVNALANRKDDNVNFIVKEK